MIFLNRNVLIEREITYDDIKSRLLGHWGKSFHGGFIEGSFYSHQELAALQAWPKSYHPEDLFTSDGVPVPEVLSLSYLETSMGAARTPRLLAPKSVLAAFIGAVLNLKAATARIYLPPDADCFLSTMAHCLRAKNYVNLMVGSKQPTPAWLSPEDADKVPLHRGASVWKSTSVDEGVDPDIVLVGIGVEVTFEVIAAAALLRKHVPELPPRRRTRTHPHPHALRDEAFDALFRADKTIHFNYHGYPIELKGLLFGCLRLERVSIQGYREEGTTTVAV
ncbi:XFP C-terminal domain-containing protein [Mycena vitilis]|nr:XFP C-terminal domain-containing protein [Mycena vitilis]